MIEKRATRESLAQWKKIYDAERPSLTPNKKDAKAVLAILKQKYTMQPFPDKGFAQVVKGNILENPYYASKAPKGAKLKPEAYSILQDSLSQILFDERDAVYGDVPILLAIEPVSNFIYVEGSNILADEVTALHGLDEKDLENVYLTANYIACTKRYPTGESK